MKSVIHACFDDREGVVRAVESLLRHGVRESDITLILPHPQMTQNPDSDIPGPEEPEHAEAEDHVRSAVVIGGEEGIGVGFGLGLLAAMCIPSIGFIDGSGAIVASLVAAGAAFGGVAGGIYGFLVERHTPHSIAEEMAYHVTSGGATVSVSVADASGEEAITKIVEAVGGRVISPETGIRD